MGGPVIPINEGMMLPGMLPRPDPDLMDEQRRVGAMQLAIQSLHGQEYDEAALIKRFEMIYPRLKPAASDT